MYSSDLVPGDFWFFGALKWELHDRHESDVELVTAINCFFQNLPPEKFYKIMIVKWKKRMLACFVNDGSYFKKYIVDCEDDNDDE